jgi:PAS domain S-box-containing protein
MIGPGKGRHYTRLLTPLAITMIYTLVGGLWILFSGTLVNVLVQNTAEIARLQTLKGLFYIAITAMMLYVLIRRNNAEIRRSEERSRAILDNLPVMVSAFDADRCLIVMWNAECERVTGYSQEEIIGNPQALELLCPDPETRQRLREEWTRCDDGYYDWEWEFTTKDGKTRTIEWSNIPAHHPIPGFGAWSVGVDVTERKQAEVALREGEHRFRSFVEQSSDGIVLTDEEGYVVEWNAGAEVITGLKSIDVLGKPVWDVQARVVPPEGKTQEVIERIIASTKHYLEQGQSPWGGGLRDESFRRPDGTLRHIQSQTFAIKTEKGHMIGGIIRDVTEQKRTEEALRDSEERYRQMFEQRQAIKLLIDPDSGQIVDANQAAADFYGYSRNTLKTLRVMDINTLPDNEVAREMQLARTERRNIFTFRHRLSSGEVRDVEVQSGPVEIQGKQLLYSIVTDITRRKEIERERERLIVELDSFAHTVAHDLKNPLNIIFGFNALLADETAPLTEEEHRRATDAIQQSTQKMLNIIDELLLLASVHQKDVLLYPLDMGEIVSEARQRLTLMIEKSGAVIITPAYWPEVASHGPWLEEVWVNYLSNAIKYGGSPPRIELGATPQPNGMIRFWVHDNGPGISPEDRERLFTPFTQVSEEAKVRATGHGLGLSIVRRIIHRLGGEVGVESKAGQGSTFSFTLPCMEYTNKTG